MAKLGNVLGCRLDLGASNTNDMAKNNIDNNNNTKNSHATISIIRVLKQPKPSPRSLGAEVAKPSLQANIPLPFRDKHFSERGVDIWTRATRAMWDPGLIATLSICHGGLCMFMPSTQRGETTIWESREDTTLHPLT